MAKRLLIVLAVLFSGSAFSVASSYTQSQYDAEPEGEEISLQLVVRNQGLTMISAILVDDDVYLPINEIFSFLKIKMDKSADQHMISGFFLEEKNIYSVDVRALKARNGSRTFELKRDDFIFTEMNLYMRRPLFGEIFGLHCAFSFRALEVVLTTDMELPVIREMMRERAQKNIRSFGEENITADRAFPQNHSFIQGGMIDWSVSSAYSSLKPTYSYSLGVGGEILGGDIEGFVSGTTAVRIQWENVPWRWRYVDADGSFFKQAIIGNIGSLSLMGRSSSILGAQISNSPPFYRRAYGTHLISDYTEPQWLVELYINQQLIDFVKADASGFYQFTVPLSYGPTYITLKFYGPWGEERSQERLIQVPYTFLPAGEIEYTLSGGRIHDEKEGNILTSNLALQAGITDFLSLSGGAHYMQRSSSVPFLPYVNTAVRVFDEILMTAEYMYQNYAKGQINWTLPSQIGVEFMYYTFALNQFYNASRLREMRRVSVNFPLRASWTSCLLRFDMTQTLYENYSFITGETGVNGAVAGIQGSVNTYFLISRSGGNTTYPSLRSMFALAFRAFDGISFRPQLEYDFKAWNIQFFRINVERNVFGLGWISMMLERNVSMKSTNIQLDFRYDFSFSQINSGVRYSGDQFSFIQSARGAIGYDSRIFTPILDNRNWVRRGALTIAPFLDINNNEHPDEDEPLVENLEVKINGGRIISAKDNTLMRVVDLEPYNTYLLEVSALNFENIAWKPKYKIYAIAVSPNQFKHIPVPITVSGEVSGTTTRVTPSGTKGQSGVRIIFKQIDGPFVDNVLSMAEGEYYYLGLPAGKYIAYVDSMQLRRLSLQSDPPYIELEMLSLEDGDIKSDLNFTLKPFAPVIAEEKPEIIPAPKPAKPDTLIVEKQPQPEQAPPPVSAPELTPVSLNTMMNLPINLQKPGLDSATIRYLDRIIATMLKNDKLIVRIEGHSDNFGTFQQNQDRSQQRAERIRAHLLKNQIKSTNIQLNAYGSRRPIAPNTTPAGRARNNRVDITLISK